MKIVYDQYFAINILRTVAAYFGMENICKMKISLFLIAYSA